MKKFLLSCFLALGISSSAQFNYSGDFENPGFSTTIYKQFGGGSQAAAAACNGAFGGQLLPTAAIAQTGYMVDLSLIGQTGNGQRVDVSVNYKKAAGVAGTIQLAYFVFDAGSNNWTLNFFGPITTLPATAITTCTALTASIPAGTLQPTGAIYGIGAWFVKSGAGNAAIYVDDIVIRQDTSVTTVPDCTVVSNPVDNSTIDAGNLKMAWSAVPTAVNYKVMVGTTSGGSDVYNGTVAGTSLNLSLAKSTTYYAKVLSSNSIGEATGCAELTFTTNTTISYCGGITASSTVYPISSVTLAGTTKTSSAATGTPVYEDFTSTIFNVNIGSTYNLDVIATGLGANRFGMTAFVDWNEDGDFNDANEKYFTTAPFIGGTGNPVNMTGALNVPAGTAVGSKRMRIKYNFNSSPTSLITALSNPCENMGNGQVEDYTLNVTELSVAPNCTTFTAPVAGGTIEANGVIKWAPAPNAEGYRLYIGTTSGSADVVNENSVTTTSYQLNLIQGNTYFAKVIPYNSIGDAIGCTDISFTANGLAYCLPAPGYATVEPTTNVTFAGINNTTSAVVGGTPAYENFSNLTGNVLTETEYTISLNANTDGNFSHFFAVFFDWNQDGDFNDAGEKYFTTAANFVKITGSNGVTGTPVTAQILVPAGAKIGATRMRVKSGYYGDAGPVAAADLTNFADGCSTAGSIYGQVEDYTIVVTDITTATSNVDKNKVSVYPNPFQDVLNISDVKGVKSISVSDISGRQVKVLKPSNTLQLSGLKTGLYIVNLNMEDGSVRSIKAIKK